MGEIGESIGLGLIGSGFMGRSHALAFHGVKAVFGDLVPRVRFEVQCDRTLERARLMADQFGFARASGDWRALLDDPKVDVVAITTPNRLHCEMAVSALRAGKHVICEKPMGVTLAEGEEMARAARKTGLVTMLGYNYTKSPAFLHAVRLVRGGILGRVYYFRGVMDEDYMADSKLEWSWRCLREQAGLGALGDMGCHVFSQALGLMGPVESLVGEVETLYASRPRSEADGGGVGEVENEDRATAMLRFTSGARGLFSTSRTVWGRKCHLAWEVHGELGTLTFTQERMNELNLYLSTDPVGESGFRKIITGPAHPPYGEFVPAPGHSVGFTSQKTIEVGAFLQAIRNGRNDGDGDDGGEVYPNFADGLEIERTIWALAESAQSGARVTISRPE